MRLFRKRTSRIVFRTPGRDVTLTAPGSYLHLENLTIGTIRVDRLDTDVVELTLCGPMTGEQIAADMDREIRARYP